MEEGDNWSEKSNLYDLVLAVAQAPGPKARLHINVGFDFLGRL